MRCSCPKCFSSINIDGPASPARGGFSRCPDCNSRFWLHQESFSLRAYKKDWKSFCIHCGEEVGSASYCRSCYSPFPECWVVQMSRPARRKSTYKADLSILLPGFNKAKKVKKLDFETTQTESFSEEIDAQAPKKTPGSGLNPLYVKGVALVIVVSLIVGGLNVLKGNDAHEEYTKAYIQALYGVTSGADYSLKKLTQISSGKPLTEQDTQQLNRMKATIEKKRLKLSPSPEQFTISLENLDGIYKAYSDLHSLTVSTVVVSSSFNEKVESLTTNLYQAEQKLKGDLPSALRQNIEVASKRYKSLDFISK